MRYTEADEKYLNKETTDYLIDRLKEKLSTQDSENINLENYYNKEDIDGLLDSLQLEGIQGQDGVTPHIGDNGNWYIGDTDTGVKAKGEDGEPGIQGEQGIPGKDGLDGADGRDGTNGLDGVSPTITESADNSDTVYKLDITDANGTFTTPNLKGADGRDGASGSGGSSSGGSDGNVYSYDETVVGTWIDGKPIYRKVFYFPTSSNDEITVANSSLQSTSYTGMILPDYNIAQIINVYGIVVNETGNSYPVNTCAVSGAYSTSAEQSEAKKNIYCYVANNRIYLIRGNDRDFNAYVFLEYIKTTD